MRLCGRRYPTQPPPTHAPTDFSAAAARAGLALACVLVLICRPALALVTLNDGTDKIYVSGTFSMGFDSNISASAANTSDVTQSAGINVEYQRRAGLIGVNASVSYSLNQFLKNKSNNSANPAYSIEFDKTTGRTTGTLNINAQRSSQADVAANVHTVSWNINTGLNLRYPVIERYSFTGSFNYGMLRYTETGGQQLINLTTEAAAVGLFYVLSEERDLYANYRYRNEASSDNTSTADHEVSFGVNGRIIGQLNGNISVGYQLRFPHGILVDGVPDNTSYRSITATGAAAYHLTKKIALNASLSKDFATTSTNATTDTTATSLNLAYSMNAKISATTGVGYGISNFLGPFGLVPGTSIERKDSYFSWSDGVSYTFNGHLSLSLSYGFFKNWSNLSFATFKRNSFTLTVSSRW